MHKTILILSFIVCLFLYGCSSENKIETSKSAKQTDISNTRNDLTRNLHSNENKPVNPDGNNTYNNTSSGNLAGKLIPAAQLISFFPEEIKGAERLPHNYGTQDWAGKKFSAATVEYSFQQGSMAIIIQDFGSRQNIPAHELVDFEDRIIQSRTFTEKITTPYGHGYLQWDDNARTGVLSLLVRDRFIVKIDANRLPVNSAALPDYLNLIKINKMIKYAETNR